ncbi:hypothetical protein [Rummeliibacillus stabekisii]|uniref:Uncharacterized protein n=1 Tax=Rummeliibacillus stabekisii TaxID=241244 RepID=A0A143H9J6_9BACL|nr:hypothetical protein [Rummeliibacillus stabekisii]AMW98417.1 hypothetical protein ATY39_02605 [Rummeliibacillus stabekisii]
MYEQAVKNDYLDKLDEMWERLKQEVLAMKDTTTAVKTETLVWHEGLKLRMVERIAREGDYVRSTVEYESLKSNEIYGPVVFDEGMFPMVEDGIYVYWGKRTPLTVEVFEVVKDFKMPNNVYFGPISLASFISLLFENEPTKEVSKLKLQSAETMAQVSKEAYEKFKEEALQSEHFKRLIKGIEESAETGSTSFLFRTTGEEDPRILDVFEEQLTQAGYRVENGFPDINKLRIEWGEKGK